MKVSLSVAVCKNSAAQTWIYNVSHREPCWYSDHLYRVIHKSLRDFRPLRYSSRDGHTEGEHVNRGRDTPSLCPTLQVPDMPTLMCLSWLLRSRVREFRRDLWVALYLSGVDYTEGNSIWSLQDFSSGQGMVRHFLWQSGTADIQTKRRASSG